MMLRPMETTEEAETRRAAWKKQGAEMPGRDSDKLGYLQMTLSSLLMSSQLN